MDNYEASIVELDEKIRESHERIDELNELILACEKVREFTLEAGRKANQS